MKQPIHNSEQYIYVDSSEDQVQQKALRFNQQRSQSSSNYQNQANKQKNNKKKNIKLCNIDPDRYLLENNYLNELQKIIKDNQQKITKKVPLLLPDTDKQILENLQKRNKNYGYFLKTLQVDKKYRQILQKKVQTIKEKNDRKKQILFNKKKQIISKADQNELKKYVLDKKSKQQQVITKIQKHTYKLGIERIRNVEKKLKTQVKQIGLKNDIKIVNEQIKQKNKIEMLKEQLQKTKQINKVNKLDQYKALKDMQKNILRQKKSLLTKAQSVQLKKFII